VTAYHAKNKKKLNEMAERGFRVSGSYSWEKFSIKVENVFIKVVKAR
jgi:hypothetical protein